MGIDNHILIIYTGDFVLKFEGEIKGSFLLRSKGLELCEAYLRKYEMINAE